MTEEQFESLITDLIGKVSTIRACSWPDDQKSQAIAQVESEIRTLTEQWGKPRKHIGKGEIVIPLPESTGEIVPSYLP